MLRILGLAMCAIASLPAIPAEVFAVDRTRNAAFASHLEQILKIGLSRRRDRSSLNQHVASAKSYRPRDPAVDYAYGLVMLKWSKPSEAATSFRAAIQKSPFYLPAWNGLLRIALLRKDRASLRQETMQLADTVAHRRTGKNDANARQSAAELLGRVVGFLKLPTVRQFSAKELASLDADLKRRLGMSFNDAYERGQANFHSEYKQLRTKIDSAAVRIKGISRLGANAGLSQVDDQKAKVTKEQGKLQRSTEQWTAWMKQQTAKAKKKLSDLEKEYRSLAPIAARVKLNSINIANQMVARATSLLARKGASSSDVDRDRLMIRLKQEARKYSDQTVAINQRAARINLEFRETLAEYAAAKRKYQKATGKIYKQHRAMTRLQRKLERTARKTRRKQTTQANPLKKRLASVRTYFNVDYESETKRLLSAYREQPRPR